MIGRKLGHYQVVEKIGEGGMGVVYRARDTRLDRDVAIKLLPDSFSADPERKARFSREAKLLATLNAPNIAAIYGLEEAEGKPCLILELVEGPTLAERLKKGRIPLEETLDLCRQIVEGMEAAHEKGIIHRDLKPANIKLTPEGKVKILDFGLAKAYQEEPSPVDISQSPTITERMTGTGVILGTAAYMSPEQSKGREVDKRTDIWAFGCILYECLAGKPAFAAETLSETLAAILKEEPDWKLLPQDMPAKAREVLRRCLQKERKLRYHDIADAWLDMESPANESSETIIVPRRLSLPWFAAGAAAVLLSGVLIGRALMTGRGTPQGVDTFDVGLPDTAPIAFIDSTPWATEWPSLVVSPEGEFVVYVARCGEDTELWYRNLRSAEARALPGTRGAYLPALSPDGQWVAFLVGGMLKKVGVDGAASATKVAEVTES